MPDSNQKICPFMSRKGEPVFCNSQCKLYRSNRPGYECHLQEMQAISWNTKKVGSAPPPGNTYP